VISLTFLGMLKSPSGFAAMLTNFKCCSYLHSVRCIYTL